MRLLLFLQILVYRMSSVLFVVLITAEMLVRLNIGLGSKDKDLVHCVKLFVHYSIANKGNEALHIILHGDKNCQESIRWLFLVPAVVSEGLTESKEVQEERPCFSCQ